MMDEEPRLLLDTCAVIWIIEDKRLSAAATNAVNRATVARRPILVSPITAWERALLLARGRVTSPVSAKDWFDGFMSRTEVALAPLDSDILMSSAFLPEPLHRDPADRILIATARAHSLIIITGDREILRYAALGHVRAIAC